MFPIKPEMLIEPSEPPHDDGFTDVILAATGVGGAGFTVTETEAEGEVHPATVCVTLTT